MELKYATLPGQLTRAETLYSPEELLTRGLKPTDKVLTTNKSIVTEQRWSKDPETLLTTNTFKQLLDIEDKAVGIVHGLCNPPLITIDVDYDEDKYNIIKDLVDSLPDKEKPLVYSESVGKVGLHLTYHYTSNRLTNYIYQIDKGGLGDSIDVLSSSGKLLFMGNKGNLTKKLVSYKELENCTTCTTKNNCNNCEHLTPVPVQLQLVIMALFKNSPQATINPARESGLYLPQHTSQPSKLGFLFEDFTVKEPIQAQRIINKFIAQRIPNDLKRDFSAPAGEEYIYQPKYYTGTPHNLLFRLSGSLKLDCGVSPAQHRDILEAINDSLPHPKNSSDLITQIIKPDQESGEFSYEEDWKNMAATLVNINKEVLDIYVLTKHTSSKSTYLVHNTDNGQTRLFDSMTEILTELNAETIVPRATVKKIVEKASLVNYMERPDKDFGLNPPEKNGLDTKSSFNNYRRNLNQVTFYSQQMPLGRSPKTPKITLAAIESQMGKQKTHELFLPFLRHKMLTREPSALIFALMGVPHSFKTGLLEGVIKPLFSSQRFLKTNGDILTEKYNDWMQDLDILFVDEFHHLSGTTLLKPVVQALNKFGSEFHEGIRSMYSSVKKVEVRQEITPFITMNKVVVPASETVGERRLVVGWGRKRVSDALNLNDKAIKEGIQQEQLDFAYYLATEVSQISYNNYHRNDAWKQVDEDYYTFMEQGIPLAKKFALAIGASYETPNIVKLKEMFPHISDCVVKLRATSNGSQYRLRLWNAQGTSYEHLIKIPGLLDRQNEIDYNSVPNLLANNDKVLTPTTISSSVPVRKQDLVITEDILIEYGLLTKDGQLLYKREQLNIGEDNGNNN